MLLPAVMALYYGYRCLFASDALLEQYGLGPASGFMVKLTGTYTLTQAIMYFILILTSPSGAWAVFAFGTIQSFLFVIFGYTTVKGPWAEIDCVKASAEGYIVPAILLVFHLIIMFYMGDIIYA